MKNVKNKWIRHVISFGTVLVFLLMSLASSDLFGPADYREGPCEVITPVSAEYNITIRVLDKATSAPIPNASVAIEIVHSTAKYLGDSKCQISPPQSRYNQLMRVTDAAGIVTIALNELTYNTNLDRTEIDLVVHANPYTSAEAARKLSPNNPNTQITVYLIDLTTEP